MSMVKDTDAPYESMVVSPEGNLIRYEVRGIGSPTLVFVHGEAGTLRRWDDQTAFFSATNTVVAIDLAGCSAFVTQRSNCAVAVLVGGLQAVIEVLDLDCIVLIGRSVGGLAITEAARAMPDRVLGLIAVDSPVSIREHAVPTKLLLSSGMSDARHFDQRLREAIASLLHGTANESEGEQGEQREQRAICR